MSTYTATGITCVGGKVILHYKQDDTNRTVVLGHYPLDENSLALMFSAKFSRGLELEIEPNQSLLEAEMWTTYYKDYIEQMIEGRNLAPVREF